MKKAILPLVVLVSFSAYSTWVVVDQGYFGFLSLARREPWALQILLDLVIAAIFSATWMRRDARERGLPVWPYLVALPFLGSIASLAYLVHRAFASRAPASFVHPAEKPLDALDDAHAAR
jgi:hypothetical protein